MMCIPWSVISPSSFRLLSSKVLIQFALKARIPQHCMYSSLYSNCSLTNAPSTANLACNLQGTTKATCSGYSSFNKGYNDGVHTGPTEVTWTSTFTDKEVEWGVLTMGALPHDPDVVTAVSETPSDFVSMPIATDGNSAGANLGVDKSVAILAAACALLAGLW
jgi:hypothetical protein